MMKIVTLTRSHMDMKVTLGNIQIKGIEHDPLYTLERPWLDNQRNISCIPANIYLCKPFSGNKYKGVYEITGVHNRSAILIHVGNTEKNTKGCVLIGKKSGSLKGDPAVLNSRGGMKDFKSLIGNEDFILLIK